MTMLNKPLGDRVARPLFVGVLWGSLALLGGLLLTVLGGGIGALVSLISSWFSDAEFGWPWELVRALGSVFGPFAVASATWAAAYVATERAPAGRALIGTVAGIGLLVLLVRLEWLTALAGAAAIAWTLAIPFEHWVRPALRVAPAVIGVVGVRLLVPDPDVLSAVIATAVSFPAAAVLVWLGDMTSRKLPPGRQ